ncbi:hypothetical protein VUR80DRAFT_8653 [Thermomyces stellatus]
MLSEDLSFEPLEFNWASDVGLVDAQISPLIDSMGTNLGEFKARGGKLLVSQGWADPLNGQTPPIKHLDEIAKATGGRREDWLALYMIPGGGHCGPATHYPQVPYDFEDLETLIQTIMRLFLRRLRIVPAMIEDTQSFDGRHHKRFLGIDKRIRD